MDQPKIERLLRLMKMLAGKRNYTIDELAEKLSADVVTVIGTKFVLYRESEKNKKISLEL